jgi:hypothetical protein
VGFDLKGDLWVANPEFQDSSDLDGDAVRRYRLGNQPTPTPTPTPTSLSPVLKVRARPKNNPLRVNKRKRIVRWENTDGTLTKMNTRCYLKGQRLNRDIEIKKKKFKRGSAGRKTVWATPSCTVGLTCTSQVVAIFDNIPGAKPETWNRTWRVQNAPKIICSLPADG